MEKIQSLEKTKETCSYPNDFEQDELLDSAFTVYFEEHIEVKIHFPVGQDPYIRKRTWHGGRKLPIVKMATLSWK